MHPEAQRLIAAFRLQPHPEGGWYRETYRSAERVTTARGAVRSATTSIYFLLTAQTFSAFHRLASDETWHFYRGDPVTLELIDPAGRHERRVLGADDGCRPRSPAAPISLPTSMRPRAGCWSAATSRRASSSPTSTSPRAPC